jgi:hypothetical protein
MKTGMLAIGKMKPESMNCGDMMTLLVIIA